MVVYWNTFHEMPMSTPPHAVAPPLTATSYHYRGSPVTKLGTGASRNRSDYQKLPQFFSALCRPPQLMAVWPFFAQEGFRIAQEEIHERHYRSFETSLVSIIYMPVSQ